MAMTKTVWPQVRQQVGDIEKIEVLVGIPTFNNAGTVGPVVKAVKEGISEGVPPCFYIGGECGRRLTGRHTGNHKTRYGT